MSTMIPTGWEAPILVMINKTNQVKASYSL